MTRVQQFYATRRKMVWEPPHQVCNQERRCSVTWSLAQANVQLQHQQVGVSVWGPEQRCLLGFPQPDLLMGPDEAQQIREQNGRENGEEGTKVFPTELPHGATACEGFMGSDFLESEGDNNTLHRSVLNPWPSPMLF